MHLKFDCIIGIAVNGVQELKLFTFFNKNPPEYEVFPELQTKHCTEINKTVLSTITFYLYDDGSKKVNFELHSNTSKNVGRKAK